MWTRLDGVEPPEPGEVIRVKVGSVGLALANDHGQFCALEDRCPHAGALLSMGSIEEGRLVCSWHGRAYSLRTGECDGYQGVAAYPVEVRHNGLYVSLDGDASTSPKPTES